MGKAFSFVSADVKSKMEILKDFRTSESKDHYETIEKMIVYEKDSSLINYKEAPSTKVRKLYSCSAYVQNWLTYWRQWRWLFCHCFVFYFGNVGYTMW